MSTLKKIKHKVLGKTSSTHSQAFRYLLVGAVGLAGDYVVLVVLTELLSMHYLLSATIGFMVGMTINYTGSIFWVFHKRSSQNTTTEFLIFVGIGLGGLVLNNFIMWSLTSFLFGLHYAVSKLVAILGLMSILQAGVTKVPKRLLMI